ncbi:TPA: TrkH family potassium uptake protein [Listeria innocua]|nr:TrkH family potassium uptake protein [Listeria innocua]HBM3984242.1 TrkH family potassium uptake protein [Listeria innocua]HDA9566872.1 TrkH family potassium uptake protein [Listeria innocua]HDT2071764.1 TrkH family potassium uptake protein [Listeria innocua]HDT2098472.1 TrkH family potassium uptake protein [Listeria innocua]
MTPVQVIIAYYFIAVTISTIVLSLPFTLQKGVKVSFIDTLFTAASSVSVTGLATVDVSQTYSTAGIWVLMAIFQIGGLGVMMISTFFYLILKRRIGLKQRQLIMTDTNQFTMSGMVRMLREILVLIFGIELVGALILGIYFIPLYPNFWEAMFQGLYNSVSLVTNAGVDITGKSLIPFANDYFVQFISILLIIAGAIGFPVLLETRRFLFEKNTLIPFRFSLFVKVTTLTYFVLLIVGGLLIWLFEYNYFFSGKSWDFGFFNSMFLSATSRSAGLQTMDSGALSVSTLLLVSFLMFIGASPSSVGGGIRTTTFAITILFIYSVIRGRKHVYIFGRELHQEDVRKSLAVTLVAGFLSISAIVILMQTETASLISVIFEVFSAFGTSGLSVGLTPDLSTPGKLIIIVLMFIGRVGIMYSMLSLRNKNQPKNAIRLPKEKIITG